MAKRRRIEGIVEKAKAGWDHWRTFKKIEAGHRFQSRYHLHQRRRQQGGVSVYQRLLNLIGGPALIIAGFAFLPTPGPSYIIIVIGLWMLSGEFLPLARAFDWTAVRLSNLWTSSNKVQKALIVLTPLTFVAALIYRLL